MSRESMMLLAGGSVIIAIMVLFYDSQHRGVKGHSKNNLAAVMQTDNSDQADNDNNSIDQIDPVVGKSQKAGKKAAQKPQVTKEQFIAFDAWPSASNTCPNTPAELPTGNAAQQTMETSDENSTSPTTPQSALNDELKSTSQLYKGLADRLDKQGLNTIEYNTRVRKLQNEYDEKIKKLFQKKQKLDATQKMIDAGSISTEQGKLLMWKLVMPEEAIKAIPAKPKPAAKQPVVSAPAHGIVTGIMHSNEIPSVLIDGEIYNEGATVRGVHIAKILTQDVEFEYNGQSWSQGVNDKPSSNWP
jgi:hypothetical protein